MNRQWPAVWFLRSSCSSRSPVPLEDSVRDLVDVVGSGVDRVRGRFGLPRHGQNKPGADPNAVWKEEARLWFNRFVRAHGR